MENELSTVFDVIVLGTGFSESLVASAAARIGKKVLHLDRNSFYGGEWASFSLTGLEEWVEDLNKERTGDNAGAEPCELNDGEILCPLSSPCSLYFGTEIHWHIPEEDTTEITSTNDAAKEPHTEGASDTEGASEAKTEESPIEGKKNWSVAGLKKLSRKFNLDLAPKILFSRGALVELLISSNVARYVEFKCVTRVLTWVEDGGGRLVEVPCSRSSVFTTDVISLVEKRLLMKFLEFCYDYEKKQDEWNEYATKPFGEFLASRSLTPKLIHFIASAIGMVEEEVNCSEGLRKTALFLNSLGRYGSMPFLFTLYGSGEMPQAFCRLCAVFEGTYILRRSVESIILSKDGSLAGVTSEGERFKGRGIVMGSGYAPLAFRKTVKKKQSVSRAVFVTDRSIMVPSDDKEQLTILRMPADNPSSTAVTVIEVGPASAVSAKGTYLVHLICGGEDAKTDLKTTTTRLFNQGDLDPNKPNILLSLYFNQVMYDLERNCEDPLPPNVFLCTGPDSALDYDQAIQQAKDIFNKLFPEEEFLPRAPDHNDIVFDSPEDTASEGNEATAGPDSETAEGGVKTAEDSKQTEE